MEAVDTHLGELLKLCAQAESTPELSLREPLLTLVRGFGEGDLIIAPEANAEAADQPEVYVKRCPGPDVFVETKGPEADLARRVAALDGDDRCVMELPVHYGADTLRIGEGLVARPAPPEAWAYQQGSYRVLESWLSDREGRSLSSEEFGDLRLAAAIEETVGLLPGFDDLVGEATDDSFTAEELALTAEG